MAILFTFDFASKQKYIFATNALREIIGASEILDKLNSQFKNEFGNDVKYSGGGNGLAVFQTQEKVDQAISFLQKNCSSYGLTFSYATLEAEKLTHESHEKLKSMLINSKKSGILPYFEPLLPHGAICQSCGRRNSTKNPHNTEERLCNICRQKQENAKNAHADIIEAMQKLNPEIHGGPEKWFLMNTDEIKEYNSENKLYGIFAVVKMDGNSLGKKIRTFLEADPKNIEKFSDISNGINEASKQAIANACCHHFKEYIMKNKKMPFRPIIIGGDDIAFLIDPSIAFEFTKTVSDEFTKNTKKLDTSSITISAGIAFTHSSFPLSKSIELAEELLSNSKKYGVMVNKENPPAMIDYQVLYGSLNDNITEIRDREYTIYDGNNKITRLWQKPYLLSDDSNSNKIENITNLASASQKIGKILKRSKIKRLKDVFNHEQSSLQELLMQLRTNVPANESKTYSSREQFDILIHWAECNFKFYNEQSKNEEKHEGILDLVEVYDILGGKE
ncbi:MAG: hypothetical protein QMC67_00035 [Candidatus Wallbacteria bacterium]